MAFNSNGQVSYLVLDSLVDGSKYGLEIIEFISQKTGGNYIMKKPTLYSCLTRMEKKGLVSSSYWGESELGGKRHYYSITSLGRQTLEELAVEFANANYDKIETTEPAQNFSYSQTTHYTHPTEEQVEVEEHKSPVFLQQDSIFNLVKEQPKMEKKEEVKKESNVVENQIDIFSFQAEQPVIEETSEEISDNNFKTEYSEVPTMEETQTPDEKEKIDYYQSILEQEPKKDDAKFLDKNETITSLTAEEEEQNKLLYDTSSELKKYRKRKSFSENQIEMSVVYEKAEDQEIQRARIEELKKSMLDARANRYNDDVQSVEETPVETYQERFNSLSSSNNLSYKQETVEELESLDEDVKDDAIFITNPIIDDNEIPVQKKITPPNIEINVYDSNLPAPKRNSNLEPTYKDMMAKLFERKNEPKKPQEQQLPQESENFSDMDSFVDYNTLQRYYNGHGISFKEYKKTNVERTHNTNFLNFLASTFLLLMSGICSAVIYGILASVGKLQSGFNFMYYTIPILFAAFAVYTFIRFKIYPSKKATLKYNSIINWAMFIVGAFAVFVINIACGMQITSMDTCLTSLILPMVAFLLAFPVHYYARKLLYKRFSK